MNATLEPPTLPEPHPTLCRQAEQMPLTAFVEASAPHHEFRDICLAVAATHRQTYDQAVDAVRTRWPEGCLV